MDVPRRNGRWDEDEWFDDENGNGEYDPGEKFHDLLRRNGAWDRGEKFVDLNHNGKWDEGESYTDSNFNGQYDPDEDFIDENGNGKFDYGPVLKLTVAKYYLPDGKSIDREVNENGETTVRGGIEPHVEIKSKKIKRVNLDSIEKAADKLKKYVDESYKPHTELFNRLAICDNFDYTQYPAFEEFYQSLDTPLTKEEVRHYLRFLVRRRVSDEMGRELLGDYQEDIQLQKAVEVLLGKLGMDAGAFPEYRFFKRNLPEEESEEEEGSRSKEGNRE